MNDIEQILEHIDPAKLNYQEWVNVGMALKHEGYSVTDWDKWSRSDTARYHSGECEKKWQSFNGSADPVTGGTLFQYAKDQGWSPQRDNTAFDWDSEISRETDDVPFINNNEGIKLYEPKNWDPKNEVIRYLETLFDASDNVGYVTETWEKNEGGAVKYLPTKGSCSRTAGELIAELNRCREIQDVIGDYKPEAGAWVRFNPLDGKGVKNENVTEFRYALVESDSMPVESQNAVLRELELPIAILVYSGGKSLHAIVKIDAADYDEYRKRVSYLYDVCRKSGLDVDKANRNPSRLSRLPGVTRNGKKQYIVDTNIGKESWDEWYNWIEKINDDLPEPESLSAEWDHLPELSPPLIDGVLRQGHKMLLAGPSKAGKSYALIELCCAIAEGTEWFGFKCTRGRILYVNLELDRASCLHRFKDVYSALDMPGAHIGNIDIWNLRGKSIPMDKLAPKLIRRASSKNYIAVIIDPIYKVITGDENSADQMAHFCNQFDKVCNELGCAVIYCHHHSKGGQGGKKSMDRASGSGVFARDPDALLDLTELTLTDGIRKENYNKAGCDICLKWITRFEADFLENVSRDDVLSLSKMKEYARRKLPEQSYTLLCDELKKAEKDINRRTAWRIEGTLREFAAFEPVDLWFDYPIHNVDQSGILNDLQVEDNTPPWQRAVEKRKENAEKTRLSNAQKFEQAYNECYLDDTPPTMQDIADYLDKPINTVRDWAKKAGYIIKKNTKLVIKADDLPENQ